MSIYSNYGYLCIISLPINIEKSQGFRYHKLMNRFTNFFHKDKDLVSKFGCNCNRLIKRISHPIIYGNVVNKPRKFKQHPHILYSVDVVKDP